MQECYKAGEGGGSFWGRERWGWWMLLFHGCRGCGFWANLGGADEGVV